MLAPTNREGVELFRKPHLFRLLALACVFVMSLSGSAVAGAVADGDDVDARVVEEWDRDLVEAVPGSSSMTTSDAHSADAAPPPSGAPAPTSSSAPAPSAAAGEQWWEAGVDAGTTYNCSILGSPYHEPLGRSWVGYWGNPFSSTSPTPAVDQVYYTKVGWGVSGFPCGNGGAYVHMEIGLPAGTQLAISSTNPVRCWYDGINSNEFRDYTNDAICPQAPQNGMQGGLAFDPPNSSEGAWPTATGAMWEIWIPVKSSQRLDGIVYNHPSPCASCFIAGVWMIDGNYSPWSYPKIGIPVAGSAASSPFLDYPIPSVENLSYNPSCPCSYGETVGFIFSEGTTGVAEIQIGTTKQYGTSHFGNITAPGNYQFKVGWNMSPDQTWHWRLCYTPTGGNKICGADQSFSTAPPPDTTAPNTTITSGPPNRTNKTTANFAFDANELNVKYECNIDGGGFIPCNLATKPMYSNLAAGSHTLQVRAIDAAGNVDATPAVRTWTVDLVAPETTITSGPRAKTSKRTAEFKFTSSERSTFLCSLDGSRFRSCSSPKSYGSLSRGSHTFKVKAKDLAGNLDTTPATHTWKVT